MHVPHKVNHKQERHRFGRCSRGRTAKHRDLLLNGGYDTARRTTKSQVEMIRAKWLVEKIPWTGLRALYANVVGPGGYVHEKVEPRVLAIVLWSWVMGQVLENLKCFRSHAGV